MMEVAIIVLGILVLVLGGILYKKQKDIIKLQNQINYLNMQISICEEEEKNLQELKEKIEDLNMENELFFSEIKELEKENGILKTKLEENEKNFQEKIALLKSSEESLKETFSNLANEIFSSMQDKTNNNLSLILNPLNEEIKEFKEKIDNLSKEEYSQINLLKEELNSLKDISLKLSDEANNLTKALKGDKKLQGIWGEVILEKVLELSGLKKGIEYEREVTLKIDDKKFRPDVIVHLPDNRDIIIDSKVSLNAYANYLETNEEKFLKEHVKNIKAHIDTLSNKNYERLENVNSLDFIFMFFPLENALIDALNYDKDLYEYAFRNKIILVSPSTLLISLRVVEAMWRYDRQAKNIKEVVDSIEKLYNKLRLFLEDFKKIEKSIDTLNDTYRKAKNKLVEGKSNIFAQIETIKEKSGINPKKEVTQWS